MRIVLIVAVLITICHGAENFKYGPLAADATTSAGGAKNAQACRETLGSVGQSCGSKNVLCWVLVGFGER